MSYVSPPDFVTKMIDAGQSKALMGTRDTLVRGFMGGAILALAAAFAITITVQTGNALVGALLFPVGFSLIYLLGFDLLTGVFTLVPVALIAGRPGVTWKSMMRNWGLVFVGNFAGALTVALMIAITVTMGFAVEPNAVGDRLAQIGASRTVGYEQFGAAGMLTLFVRGILCNWMVSTGVVAAMMSRSVSGKVVGMWMPIIIFFYLNFEHSVVNMFLFPIGLMLGGEFTVVEYLLWNEIPTVLGNLVGGLVFVGFTLYFAHARPGRRDAPGAGTDGATPDGDGADATETNAGTKGTITASA